VVLIDTATRAAGDIDLRSPRSPRTPAVVPNAGLPSRPKPGGWRDDRDHRGHDNVMGGGGGPVAHEMPTRSRSKRSTPPRIRHRADRNARRCSRRTPTASASRYPVDRRVRECAHAVGPNCKRGLRGMPAHGDPRSAQARQPPADNPTKKPPGHVVAQPARAMPLQRRDTPPPSPASGSSAALRNGNAPQPSSVFRRSFARPARVRTALSRTRHVTRPARIVQRRPLGIGELLSRRRPPSGGPRHREQPCISRRSRRARHRLQLQVGPQSLAPGRGVFGDQIGSATRFGTNRRRRLSAATGALARLKPPTRRSAAASARSATRSRCGSTTQAKTHAARSHPPAVQRPPAPPTRLPTCTAAHRHYARAATARG